MPQNPCFLTNGNQILTTPLFQMECQISSNPFKAKRVKTLNIHSCSPAPCPQISDPKGPRPSALTLPHGKMPGISNSILALSMTQWEEE